MACGIKFVAPKTRALSIGFLRQIHEFFKSARLEFAKMHGKVVARLPKNIISASSSDCASVLRMNTRQNLREGQREYRQESSDAILPLEVLEVPKLKFKALATCTSGSSSGMRNKDG